VPNDVIATCPVCSHELSITRLHCDHCATTLEGDFSVGRFGRLSREQLALLESFLRSRGNLREMERELGISYPTVRNRVEALVRALGLAVRGCRSRIRPPDARGGPEAVDGPTSTRPPSRKGTKRGRGPQIRELGMGSEPWLTRPPPPPPGYRVPHRRDGFLQANTASARRQVRTATRSASLRRIDEAKVHQYGRGWRRPAAPAAEAAYRGCTAFMGQIGSGGDRPASRWVARRPGRISSVSATTASAYGRQRRKTVPARWATCRTT
jgi:hypothetical protein